MFLFGLTEVDEGLTSRFNRGRGRSLISNRARAQVRSNRGRCMRSRVCACVCAGEVVRSRACAHVRACVRAHWLLTKWLKQCEI